MNTKDEAQFTRSKNLSLPLLLLPPRLVLKLQQEVASGEDRGGKKQGGNDRGTLGRETEAERWREREREGGAGCDRQRRAEEGRKMKGNLMDEKEEQEKGVAVRKKHFGDQGM